MYCKWRSNGIINVETHLSHATSLYMLIPAQSNPIVPPIPIAVVHDSYNTIVALIQYISVAGLSDLLLHSPSHVDRGIDGVV